MLVAEFEELAHAAPETVWLEFIDGKLEVKPPHDGNHGAIVVWLLRQCLYLRPDLSLYPYLGLKSGGLLEDRVRPDGALAHDGQLAGHGGWSDPNGFLMTVEVTLRTPGNDRRCQIAKRDGYAAAGIPVHVLVDRDTNTLSVYSEPEKGRYRKRTSHPFGATVPFPGPVGITLKTERLKDYTQ
ncbi:Uma2 family endonuclease [Streptomyces sp. A3M-1-3]|nr:Uma2 family endonuclease [Streptomyces sp. A3M-1-3]